MAEFPYASPRRGGPIQRAPSLDPTRPPPDPPSRMPKVRGLGLPSILSCASPLTHSLPLITSPYRPKERCAPSSRRRQRTSNFALDANPLSVSLECLSSSFLSSLARLFTRRLVACALCPVFLGPQGGKNRRRGKNEADDDKRELVFKEDGQGGFPRFFSRQWSYQGGPQTLHLLAPG